MTDHSKELYDVSFCQFSSRQTIAKMELKTRTFKKFWSFRAYQGCFVVFFLTDSTNNIAHRFCQACFTCNSLLLKLNFKIVDVVLYRKRLFVVFSNELLFFANAAPFTLRVDVTPPGIGDPCRPLKKNVALLQFFSEFYNTKIEWKV